MTGARARVRSAIPALAAAMVLAAFGACAAEAPDVKQDDDGTTVRTSAAHARPQFGIASVYARMLHGRRTASGEQHDGNDNTAAHRTLPLGTMVRVTNLANQRSVVVRINDRGPRVRSRIIDLSPGAAARIGVHAKGKGLARVRLDVIGESTAADEEKAKP